MSNSYKGLGWIILGATIVVILLMIVLFKALMTLMNPWEAFAVFIIVEEGVRFLLRRRTKRNAHV